MKKKVEDYGDVISFATGQKMVAYEE